MTDYELEIADNAGNIATTRITIDWILGPPVTYSPAQGEWTKGDVTATIDFGREVTIEGEDAPVTEKEIVITENGTMTLTYTYIEVDDIEPDPELRDEFEVTKQVTLHVDWIDRTPPIGSVFYSTGEGGGIVATLVASDNSGQPVVLVDEEGNDIAGDWTRTFTENGVYTFHFRDAAGNTASANAEVRVFETTPPVLTVTYSTTELTNSTVRAVLHADEPIFVINEGLDGRTYYDFEENGTFTFIAKDRFGNVSEIEAIVNHIDKVAPIVDISLSTTEVTNQNVVATITANEPIKVLNNRDRTSYIFQENGSFTFIISDLAGNIVSKTVTVTNIDKTVAEYTLKYSNVDDETGDYYITNGNITVTVVPVEEGSFSWIENDGIAVFERNGMQWLRAVDRLGNEMLIEIVVQWIDRDGPQISIDGDFVMQKNGVIPDLEAGVTAIDNYGVESLSMTHNIVPSKPGEYEVTYTAVDQAGNMSSAKRKVRVVDEEELSLYINGQRIEEGDLPIIQGNDLVLDVFGTQGEWEILFAPGQLRIGEFKRVKPLTSNQVIIDKQGYYSFLISDQEWNDLLIHVYIIPKHGKGV